MSILSNIAEGWFSYKTSSGYQKLAPRTKSTLVSMEDGTSVENKVNSVAQGNNSVSFTQAGIRQNISASDTIKTILGKISKWFADLKTVAFSGSYNDLSNKPTIVNNGTTTTTNTVLDGRMGKTLADKDTNLQSQITSLNSALTAIIGGLPSSSGGRVEFTAHEYPAGECLVDEQVSTHKCTIAYMRLYYTNDRNILIGAMFGTEDPNWWSKYVATSKLLIQKQIGSDYFGWTSI